MSFGVDVMARCERPSTTPSRYADVMSAVRFSLLNDGCAIAAAVRHRRFRSRRGSLSLALSEAG